MSDEKTQKIKNGTGYQPRMLGPRPDPNNNHNKDINSSIAHRPIYRRG